MADSKLIQAKHELGPLQFLTLILSIYVLIVLFIENAFSLPEDVSDLLSTIDTLVCFVFLADFSQRFYRAPNKLKFMKWGWIDLLSSIPMVDALRYGRFIHLVRFFRILRAIRSTKVILYYLFHNRRMGTFTIVASVSVLLVIFGAIGILQFEKGLPESNIHTASDALWWAFVTITTVGYGDFYPVSAFGRAVAAVLMTAGVGLFGTFTGLVANWFMLEEQSQTSQHDQQEHDVLKNEIHVLHAELNEIKQLIKEQGSSTSSNNDSK
ncbi:ion transporter [Vibrio sp. UCD-FRSSP16_10]|uniref:ion transporter n=1 Tax=unclassified Vibrio TaxID=2614977 RepID=UPI0007FB9CED|nr:MULTISPECIES: ion transporter [unclassified Vibrio]OBT07938.1 ion transporter [Vibrio sp. UCD-FRSSP16_30]OBT17113.1 ion transporter [Vibrio sp. UCD-FRSSP16_10]